MSWILLLSFNGMYFILFDFSIKWTWWRLACSSLSQIYILWCILCDIGMEWNENQRSLMKCTWIWIAGIKSWRSVIHIVRPLSKLIKNESISTVEMEMEKDTICTGFVTTDNYSHERNEQNKSRTKESK